jgi:hypothetical protein
MQKDVLYSASSKKHKEQQAAMTIASFQKSSTSHQAQSSQAKNKHHRPNQKRCPTHKGM